MRPVNRLSVALALLCAGLGVWVYLQWVDLQAIDPVPEQRAAGAGATVERVTAPQPPPMPPLASYSEIVERPLFDDSRRPPPAPTAQRAMAVRLPGNFRLEGTALTPDGQVAVLRDTRTSELHRLAIGESVNGWQLDQVEPGQAALSQGAQKLQLELERPTNTPVR